MATRKAEARAPLGKAILIVDDHPMLRRGLASLIESEPDLTVCAEAGTYSAGLEAVQRCDPDLIILDIALDGRDGLSLLKEIEIRRPKSLVLVLSMHDGWIYAERALRAGARGYVSKQQLDETVLLAIRRVLGGEIHLSEALKARFCERFLAGPALGEESPLAILSDRELEVYRLIGFGQSTRNIAAGLHLSIKTIESHREHIKQKLDFDSGVQLAQRATRWVETGEPD